jgi:hypothetical protein
MSEELPPDFSVSTWSISGIIVCEKKLHLVSVCATDLILDLPSWARDLALGQAELACTASTPKLKEMFEENAKILHRWAERDAGEQGDETRHLATAAPYLAARAARGYPVVHSANFFDFLENVMRRAVPAKKGDTLAFIFIADPEAPEIHATEADDYLVRYAMQWVEAQIWSQRDFDDLCLAAMRAFPAQVAEDPDLNHLTPKHISDQALMQGIISGVMPAGIRIETSERPTTTSKQRRIPKKRQ